MDIESPTPKLVRKRSEKRKASRSPVRYSDDHSGDPDDVVERGAAERPLATKRQRSDVDLRSLSISDRGRYVTANALLRRMHFERVERSQVVARGQHSREAPPEGLHDAEMDFL